MGGGGGRGYVLRTRFWCGDFAFRPDSLLRVLSGLGTCRLSFALEVCGAGDRGERVRRSNDIFRGFSVSLNICLFNRKSFILPDVQNDRHATPWLLLVLLPPSLFSLNAAFLFFYSFDKITRRIRPTTISHLCQTIGQITNYYFQTVKLNTFVINLYLVSINLDFF